MRDTGFVQFIPYTVIASVALAIWGTAMYCLGAINDARRDRPAQERRLNRQRWIMHSVGAIGGLWLVEWFIFATRQGSLLRTLAMMSMFLVSWCVIALNWWFERRIMRAVPYPLPDLLRQEEELIQVNRRVEEIAERLGSEPEGIAISSDLRAISYAGISHGQDGKLHLSRLLLDVMSPQELDYILAREFAPLRGLDRIGLYSALLPIGAFAIVLVIGMLLGDLSPALEAAVCAALLSVPGAVWLSQRSECAKDLLALRVAGDPAVAESAIAKSMKHGCMLVAIGDTEKDRRVQRRLAALRVRIHLMRPSEGG